MTQPPNSITKDIEQILAERMPDFAPEDRPLLSFFNMKGMSVAILAESFTQEELVSSIIQDVRSPDARIRQKAVAQFLSYVKEIATVNGRIGRAVISENQDGQVSRKVEANLLGINPGAGARVPGATILHARNDLLESERVSPDPVEGTGGSGDAPSEP